LRWLQNTIILTIATAFGFGLGAQAVYFGLSLLFGRPKGENYGGAIILVGMVLIAGLVGAVIGFVNAVRWITQHETQPWRPPVWIGLLLGLAVGVLVTHFTSARHYWWFWSTRAAFFMPACGIAGGLLAGLIARKSNRPTPRRRRK
jgi:hypothetical protein